MAFAIVELWLDVSLQRPHVSVTLSELTNMLHDLTGLCYRF